MKKKILFLTNFYNGYPKEDIFLIDVLKPDFEIIVCHPLDCEKYLSSVQGVIIRNIWPKHEYAEGWERIQLILKESGLPIYNSLTGRGDQQKKKYLVQLFKEGYPVIPTIDSLKDIKSLPEQDYYFLKLKDSCDGIGSKKVSRDELATLDLTNSLLQPFVEFDSEPSFFFIDNSFAYGVTMPHRIDNYKDFKMYVPTKEDLEFAQSFVDWNTLSYGIQRIDAVRTKDGKLLLTEIEDISEVLYLREMDEENRNKAVKLLVESINKVFR